MKKPVGGFASSEQNFCISHAFHGEAVWILLSDSDRRSRTAIVDLLGAFALMLVFLSFLILVLKGLPLGSDVSGLLAIVASARVR